MTEIPLIQVNNYTITLTPVEHRCITTSSLYSSFDIHELYNKGIKEVKENHLHQMKSPNSQKVNRDESVKGKSFEEVYQRLIEKQREQNKIM